MLVFPQHRTPDDRNGAFTLIELLVVVAIIVSLLAILLPSLGRATHVAQTAKCAANQRQLSIANMSYAADFFVYIDTRWGGSSYQGTSYTRYWAVDPNFIDRLGLHTPDVSNKWLAPADKKPEWGNGWKAGVRWDDADIDCPLERERDWWLQKTYWGHEMGYGYNRGELNIWTNNYRPAGIVAPARKVQFGDSDGWWMHESTANYKVYTDLGTVDHGGWSGLVPRHVAGGGTPGMNIAFWDGHVDWLPTEQTFFYTSGTTPNAQLNHEMWYLTR